MTSQESRIQQQLIANALAEHRAAVAKLAPLGAGELLAAARRLSAAGRPAARALH